MPVLVTKAVETNVPVQVSVIGNVTPCSTVTIRSQITGKLQEVHFKEGQSVQKGELLFTIDPRPLQVALDQAKANLARDAAQLENAKLHFEREKGLFDSKLVSQEEFDNARARNLLGHWIYRDRSFVALLWPAPHAGAAALLIGYWALVTFVPERA